VRIFRPSPSPANRHTILPMSDVIILLMIITLAGGGFGYCGFHLYGNSGFAAGVGLTTFLALLFWFAGGMRVRRG